MILLNFSHPLTAEQLQRVGGLIGQTVARVDGGHMTRFDWWMSPRRLDSCAELLYNCA